MLIREDPTLDEQEAREEGPLAAGGDDDDEATSMTNPVAEDKADKAEPDVEEAEPDDE